MKREIFVTQDGSHSIKLPEWNEQYHSKHGAIQEAEYVFLDKGLAAVTTVHKQAEIAVLEIGFGTGLNALLTAIFALEKKIKISYTALEAYPLTWKDCCQLNYPKQLNYERADALYKQLHQLEWGSFSTVNPRFRLQKKQQDFRDFSKNNAFNLIYFDAFGPRVQPELWTESVFENMHDALQKNGVLVTYSAKGSVRRTLESIGFKVERLPGPPGKREMLRAIKS